MSTITRLLLALFLRAAISSDNEAFGQSAPGESVEPSYPSYHSMVSEVRLVFFATENDRPAQNLSRGDFAVVDDERVIRAFRSFTLSASSKLDIIVLFDTSESALAKVQTGDDANSTADF